MLEIRGLTVRYDGRLTAVRDLDLEVSPGELVALAGESGSGKSTVARALLGLLPSTAEVTGSARLGDLELIGRAENRWRGIRGPRVGIVPQGAMTGLNPVRRIGAQLAEMLHLHAGVTGGVATARSRGLLRLVRLDPSLLRAYPHQLSGGMRQRVAIALALAGEPDLLIADEPTTGLDAVIQRHILELLDELRHRQLAVLVVSHDLPGLLRHADRVAVMYAGRIVELRGAPAIGTGARHPYTRGLVAASAAVDPALPWRAIPGSPPALGRLPRGCSFADRCPLAEPQCREHEPELLLDGNGFVACHLAAQTRETSYPAVPRPTAQDASTPQPVAQLRAVSRTFHDRRRTVVALRQVDLDIDAGTVVGLVGESGSGKTTLARLLLGLLRPTEGSVRVGGRDMGRLRGRALRAAQRRFGYVHQDCYGSLHPAMRVAALVAEPLRLAGLRGAEAGVRVRVALASAGLPTDREFLARFPHGLSGGQRQRVALARALVNRPALLVADEATSMLDVSTRASVAAALRTLADEQDLAVLFVTHDLGEAVQLCDRIIVLKDGETVESGTPQALVSSPAHPYTAELLGAATAPAR